MDDVCLEYESQFFVETFNESFLLIASKGLCVERFFLKHLQLYSDPSVLVLVVGAGKSDQDYFHECLIKSGQPEPKRLTSETGTAERRGLYLEGGVQFATTTILISDLLSDRIPLNLVTGILVYRAHSVLKSALESFILLMFRKKKPEGFIKAFSDSPSSFVRTFGQLQRAVSLLRIQRVRFLPRYQIDVVENLDKFRPQLVELAVELSPAMKVCQNCLLELINACVMELKRSKLPPIDENELTLEYALLPWFEDKIRKVLDSNIEKLSDKVQQLLVDINRLRNLLVSLEIEEGASFAKALEQIKNNPTEYRNNSGWLFTSTAEKLFQVGLKRKDETPTKFNALKTALKELTDLNLQQIVLIIVSEQKVCEILKDLITSYTEDQTVPADCTIDVGFENAELNQNKQGFKIILLSHIEHYNILRSLTSLKPSAVIIFNVDIWLIRQLELHNATQFTDDKLKNFRIYFLMYQNSAEEQRYLTSLKHERESFEQLFKEETTLLIRKDNDQTASLSLADNASRQQTIVVDLREFRSELPMLLHLRELKLIPATLTVADYVLSPEICVERKSASDLIGSLQSGRLLTQCKSMCNYYERPFVLIELNNVKKGWRRVGDQLSAKLSVLCLTLPQIRFVWAASPAAAADLLEDFKWKRAEPDIEKAVEFGKETQKDDDSKKSLWIERMLTNLPGISSKNVNTLARKRASLRELCKQDEDQLNSTLQSSSISKNLYNFFRKDFRNVKIDAKVTRKRK